VDRSTGSCTILANITGIIGADPELPSAEVITSAKVVLLDYWGFPGMLRAAQIAQRAGIPRVGDFEEDDHPLFAEVLALVDHLILPLKFAYQITNTSSPEHAVTELWKSGARKAVVVTDGEHGCWGTDNGSIISHYPAFAVAASDTTGCGDVFHGAYAAMLAKGMHSFPARIHIASAAAALKARDGGDPPSWKLVKDFADGCR